MAVIRLASQTRTSGRPKLGKRLSGGGGLGPAPPTRAPRKSLLVRQPGEHRPDHEDGESNHHPILEAHPVRIDPHADASLTLVLN